MRGNTDTRMPIGWTAGQWEGSRALELVRELNGRCLQSIALAARCTQANQLPIVNALAALWRDLDTTTVQRAAEIPVLLLDLEFRNTDWWRWAKERRGGAWNGNGNGIFCLPARLQAELMRETVMLAWYVVRMECGAADVLLGMSRDVAATIASFGLSDIERIASRHARFLRFRWAGAPHVWRELLVTAKNIDDDALCDIHLRGLQLLGGEMLAHRR